MREPVREDDFASSLQIGLAQLPRSALKPLEAQGRGFAHGHEKIISVPRWRAARLKQLRQPLLHLGLAGDDQHEPRPYQHVSHGEPERSCGALDSAGQRSRWSLHPGPRTIRSTYITLTLTLTLTLTPLTLTLILTLSGCCVTSSGDFPPRRPLLISLDQVNVHKTCANLS